VTNCWVWTKCRFVHRQTFRGNMLFPALRLKDFRGYRCHWSSPGRSFSPEDGGSSFFSPKYGGSNSFSLEEEAVSSALNMEAEVSLPTAAEPVCSLQCRCQPANLQRVKPQMQTDTFQKYAPQKPENLQRSEATVKFMSVQFATELTHPNLITLATPN